MKEQEQEVGGVPGPTQSAGFYYPTHDFDVKQDRLPMPDGVKLAVTYFIPKPKTDDEKFPIVLEMLPYRKDDSFYQRDHPIYAYLARRGIAGARVDVRGTGSSEGRTPEREYSDAELDDIVEAIKQLAALPWCNGNIGMQGISWSAFNALMTAMRNPPNLKAILVAHGSEDLFGNDIHYIDGCLHIDLYMVEMETENIVPRPPDYSIDEAYINDRFNAEPWIFTYLRHYRDGDFWRKGRSLFTDYGAIKIPVYAIGALLDGYRDYVLNMLANVTAPMKAEIGTWNHDWPDEGVPGPNYEWRQTAVRWWQKWLNEQETGVTAEPRLTVFVRGSVPPDLNLATTPGYYWALDWTDKGAPGSTTEVWYPQRDHSLAAATGVAEAHTLAYQPDAGIEVGNWWGERTGDMQEDDKACGSAHGVDRA